VNHTGGLGTNGRSSAKTTGLHILVVIVAYGAINDVRKCVDSLQKSEANSNVRLSIVIVDNFPGPVYSDALREISDLYIPRHDNPGFGTSCNLGIRVGLSEDPNTDHVMLLNPDATVDDYFFSRLEKIASDGLAVHPISPAIVFDTTVQSFRCSQIDNLDARRCLVSDPAFLLSLHDEDGTPVARGEVFEIHAQQYLAIGEDKITAGQTSFLSYRVSDETEERESQIIDLTKLECTNDYIIQNLGSFVGPHWAAGDDYNGFLWSQTKSLDGQSALAWCGAAVVLPTNFFSDVGFFDERFFLYFEDTELAVRGSDVGLHAKIFPSLLVRHSHSGTTSNYPRRRAQAVIESQTLFSSLLYGVGITLVLSLNRFGHEFFEVKSRKQAGLNLLWSAMGFARLIRKPNKRWLL
jgi:GT2 family glycosyltransferase